VPEDDGSTKEVQEKLLSLRAVIDTNIFVSGIINPAGFPGQILKALREGAFTLISSPSINEEILEVLSRPRLKKYRLQDALFDIGVILSAQAELIQEKTQVKVSPDPDDDKFLAAAIDGKAHYIVTGDKSGLLQLGEYRGIRVITARTFLSLVQETKGIS
jgi:putative PIN family toxin of toxin-antitoxin system